MNATKQSQKMINVNLSLSIADYEWFEAYAKVTGKTFSEAASKGMAEWLNSSEGYGLIEDLIANANAKSTRIRNRATCEKPSNLIVFPGR